MSYSLDILGVIHSGELPVNMPPSFWHRPTDASHKPTEVGLIHQEHNSEDNNRIAPPGK